MKKIFQIFFHKHGSNEPCPHMVEMLNKTADGNANRFERWYALAHAAQCGPCRKFLQSLENMLVKLKDAKEESSQEALDRLAAGPWRDAIVPPSEK